MHPFIGASFTPQASTVATDGFGGRWSTKPVNRWVEGGIELWRRRLVWLLQAPNPPAKKTSGSRDREALALVAGGSSNEEIAARLYGGAGFVTHVDVSRPTPWRWGTGEHTGAGRPR